MQNVIRTFEEAFSYFIDSGYKVPEDTIELQKGIEWYNTYLMWIALDQKCPMSSIQDITYKNYMWAYSSGIIACTHMNYLIINTN